jgi:hypothetical protein
MKTNTNYYARIIAYNGDTAYTSETYPLKTGFLQSGMPEVTIAEDNDPGSLFAGGAFTAYSTGISTMGTDRSVDSLALIIDKDADIVWAYDVTNTTVSGPTRARMSFDGDYMWVGNFANMTGDGALLRVTMDGLDSDEYSLPKRNHDFGVLPNGNIVFHEENPAGYQQGDIIKELDPETGNTTTIYDEATDFSSEIGASRGAHTNYVTYVPFMNAILFSMAFPHNIGIISYPDAKLLGVFGGSSSWFSGLSWTSYVHGVHLMEDSILVFLNTGSTGMGNSSSITEYSYDLDARTHSQIFDYSSSGRQSTFLGDVRRLPNGNTFITYCSNGVFQEIDSSKNLIREMTTSVVVGYAEHRKTLYGAPPPYDN